MNWLNASGWLWLDTPLHIAARRGFNAIVEMLLSAGAKVDVENVFGFTALYEVVLYGRTPEMELLVRAGANVNAAPRVRQEEEGLQQVVLDAVANLKSSPALVSAVRQRNINMIRQLLDWGANLNAILNGEWWTTALHCAVEKGRWPSLKVVQLLLEMGADVHAVRYDGLTPVQLAIKVHGAHVTKTLFAGYL
jgi:hypothetical protein